jgi:hypothetical protein
VLHKLITLITPSLSADNPLRSLLPVPPLHHHTPGSVPVLAPLPWVPSYVRKRLAPAVEEALLGGPDPHPDRLVSLLGEQVVPGPISVPWHCLQAPLALSGLQDRVQASELGGWAHPAV